MEGYDGAPNSPSPSLARRSSSDKGGDSPIPHQRTKESGLNWTPWKTGMAFSYRGRTLMVMKQASNEPCDEFLEAWQLRLRLLKAKHRIEVHIYTNEWVALINELLELNSQSFSLENLECVPGLATKLMIMVTAHVRALAVSWFPGMMVAVPTSRSSMSSLSSAASGAGGTPFVTYMPCWKCYAEVGSSNSLSGGEGREGVREGGREGGR